MMHWRRSSIQIGSLGGRLPQREQMLAQRLAKRDLVASRTHRCVKVRLISTDTFPTAQAMDLKGMKYGKAQTQVHMVLVEELEQLVGGIRPSQSQRRTIDKL